MFTSRGFVEKLPPSAKAAFLGGGEAVKALNAQIRDAAGGTPYEVQVKGYRCEVEVLIGRVSSGPALFCADDALMTL